MKKIFLALAAALALITSVQAVPQFSATTTYSQDLTPNMLIGFGTFAAGFVTKIQGSLPMSVDLTNVSEGTAFRINASTMWYGDNFQVLLGQDPKYKRGAAKANISTPNGNVQLSWTATNLTFSGTLVDYYTVPFFGVAPTIFPFNTYGAFTTNTSISIHFQYSDYSHPAQIVGTNLATYVEVPVTMPALPTTVTYQLVNNGSFHMTADLTPPMIRIISPANNSVVTNDNINVHITVSDNVTLGAGPLWLGAGAVLSYTINGGSSYGDPDTAPGVQSSTHNINFNGMLQPGTNTIVFIASDSSMNLSTNTLVLFYSQKSPITLVTNGVGGITGITNGQKLEVGRGYVINARPGTGKVLSEWQDGNGNVLGRSNALTFIMSDSLMLTASFADNPFPAVQGTYWGYFLRHGVMPNAKQLGGLKMTVTASGSFSGTVNSGAGTGTFSGQFLYNSNGVQDTSTYVVAKNSTNRLLLSLTTDSGSGNFAGVQGTLLLNNNDGVSSVTPRIPVAYADVNAARETNSSVLPAGASTYHFLVGPATNDVNFPGGTGFGTFSVTANGSVTGSLTLADGDAPTTAFSSHVVNQAGYVPVFVPLYNKGGGFLMTLTLPAVPTDGSVQLNTSANWVKSAGGKFYPDGFTTLNDVYVARYTKLPTPAPFGTVNLELDPDVVINAAVGLTNSSFGLLTADPSKVKGTITPVGAVSGSFVDNGVNRTFKGLVTATGTAPNGFEGAGFFVRSNQTGMVSFGFSENP
jgi:hypothetical protein